MLSKMRAPKDGGSRIGIVFNGSPLFTGDAGSGESNIRQCIIENDWLEAVVALPDQLFLQYRHLDLHLVLTNRKERERKGKISSSMRAGSLSSARASATSATDWRPLRKAGEPDQIGDIDGSPALTVAQIRGPVVT
jgi:type I restriction enzyme M protein